MFNRRSITLLGFALLCAISTTGISAKAGSISYEGLEGARCNVSTDTPSSINFNSGWSEHQGSNVNFELSIPFGSPTAAASTNCVKFAEQDQQRQHFVWLLEMYETGVITREALEKEATRLGMELAPESSIGNSSSSVITVK